MNKNWRLLALIMFLCIAGSAYLLMEKPNSEELQDASSFDAVLLEDSEQMVESGVQNQNDGTICVYICGEVKHPGVYSLEINKRMVDLLEACGGFTKNADKASVNLARSLNDGEQITILSKQKNLKVETSETNDGKTSLNTASKEELMSLPGIGEAKADSIIAYRELHPFTLVEDIMKIEGIKDGIFQKLKSKIKI